MAKSTKRMAVIEAKKGICVIPALLDETSF
nr:MAG TPA: hypothetical protein [Bacteriophage sp.]DAZ81030.1 MAG TPA: hypothetical protein [Caudoviricetes sp.]